MWRTTPKEEKFFDMFQAQADHVVKSAKALVEILENYNFDAWDPKAGEIRPRDNEGDILAHDIIRKLNQNLCHSI